MSRVRIYELPAPGRGGERPVPSKEQILTVISNGRWQAMTKPEIMLGLARLYVAQPEGTQSAEAAAWARTIIDMPNTERRFDKMVRDELVVGKFMFQWKALGLTMHGQGGTTYYVTADRAADLEARNEALRQQELRARAAALAAERLIAAHHDEYVALLVAAHAELSRPEGEL